MYRGVSYILYTYDLHHNFVRSPTVEKLIRTSVLLWFFLSSFFSPRNLRAPSADRRKILHDARSCGQFYNPGPKFWRSLPKKFLGTKNMQNLARFQNVCGVHEIFSDCFMTIFFVESFDERI